MPHTFPDWLDGIATGLAATGIIVFGWLVSGRTLGTAGTALFLIGTTIAILSLPLAAGATRRPPRGLLNMRRRHAGDDQPPPERPISWWDRVLTTENVWLVAGITIIVLSFMPPFLRG